MANAECGAQARILVVDDDESTRELLAVLLRRKGYGVHSAADGEEAWTLLNAELHYDLVITDLNMPVMDGLQLLQRMREHALPIEVILQTGFLGYGAGMRARDLGVFAVFQKPHSVEEILRRVELALMRRTVAGKEGK
jgi:DNA-binding NtrC family response regulator